MRLKVKIFIQQIIGFLYLVVLLPAHAFVHHYRFVIKEAPYSRLCSSKNILTVNGQFPGPVIYANTGDTLVVNVQNNGSQNITIHWHGVKQPRYSWSDGPEYITQCPIRPGTNFSQRINLSDEEGTLWWHAHSDWSRATVNGALVIHPANKTNYPFPKPTAEIPIVLGEWWKSDVQEVLNEFLASGGDANKSDAFLINGQPGDLCPCSKNGFGNFDKDKDPLNYNLVDPPHQNTIAIVRNGWAAIRFKADNPGVWFMHCHLERHVTWGMEMTFIVKDGKGSQEKLLPPPPDMPKC